MTMPVLLIINSGSSSVKFQVFSYTPELDSLARGKIANLGTEPEFSAVNETTETKDKERLSQDCDHEQAIQLILQWLKKQNQNWKIKAAAHRVVHGGELFTHSVLINAEIMQQLKKLNPLVPLHQPHNLAAIDIIHRIDPDLPQIACFDTAFHAGHGPLFSTYALPLHLREQGIRRYGFHGLSYEWIAYSLKKEHPDLADGRVVTAHLGNGASLCAMHKGVSIDTTMGLTALDGLPMGTRCGSLDPGAITYMIRELGLSSYDVEDILYNESGLLGLSGLTNDVKVLQSSPEESARFALDYFCLKAAQFIAMMTVSLGGIDGLVFTGGIGENSAVIRENILSRLGCLPPCSVLVIPANEEKMMAMHSLSLLKIQLERR
ncbi:acetate/propionate family kinase [Legionella shakespearei]|uniref:Acetate kinase n=1 Tax=Legionella shakespearei DSM 23087 TaxID=1122169 RepID=A0A0W0Z0M1_9GAMM|nr:acetate/propionate family kinase [Legionella shakespearei]KTD62688.1 acetate kinase [Legionella shakespearei DSM 23087]